MTELKALSNRVQYLEAELAEKSELVDLLGEVLARIWSEMEAIRDHAARVEAERTALDSRLTERLADRGEL